MSFKERWWCAAVFFATYLFYLFTLYPSVAAEDAGEFSTAVATLGIAHPPGYPVYILLGKVFTLLIPFGSLAWKVNLFSAFCGAVSAVLFYLCLKLFTRDDFLSFCGAILFAAGSIFWSQSIRAEVYTLNSVFLLLLLFLLFLWHEKRHDFSVQESKRFLLFIVFLFGFSLGNHYLMLLGAVPFLLFVLLSAPHLFKDWKFWCKGLLFFGCGWLVYLYLPIRASMNPPLNWGNASTWENFWNHVTRKIYSAGAVDPSMHLQAGVQQSGPELFSGWWFDDVTRYHIWQMFLYVMQHFAEEYFWGLLLFVPAGFWWFWKKSKAYFWLFAALFVFYSFVLSKLLGLGYAGRLAVDLFKDRPFYIPVLTLLCLLSVVGVYGVSRKFLKKSVQKLCAVFLGGVMFFNVAVHFPVENQSQNYIANDLARLAFAVLPQNAVYIVQNGDNTFFPVLYLNKVEGLRPDLKFYIPSPISIYNFFTDLENLERQNPGRRIFTDFPFTDYAGKSYDFFGPISEIVSRQNLSKQKKLLSLLENWTIRGIQAANLDHFHRYLYGRFSLDLALVYGKIDDQKQREFFNAAMTNAPDSVNIFSQLIGNYYVRRSMFEEAIPFLEKARLFYPDEYPVNFQLFMAYMLTGNPQGAMPYFSSLMTSQRDLFIREYNQVKKMFPQNASEFDNFEKLIKANGQAK